MIKRFLFSITTAVILTLSLVQQLSAQDGRQITRSPIINQSAPRSTVTPKTPEQIRAELVAVYVEAEATFKYLSRYAIARDSFQQSRFGEVSDVIANVAESRKLIEAMPDSYLEIMYNSFPDSKAVSRLANGLRKIREDASLQAVMERSDKWYSSESARVSRGEDANADLRSSPSAPSFIKPVCHFDNLNNYPSATDVGIAKGVAFALEIVTLLIPPTFEVPIIGVDIPSPVRIIAAIAWGVSYAIVIGLENARDEGTYCMNLAFTIQGVRDDETLGIISLLMPPTKINGGTAIGGYADFLQEFVTAAITNAKNRGITIPMGTVTDCATERLNEANSLYGQGNKYVEAFKKYRAAYQNIGASVCVQ